MNFSLDSLKETDSSNISPKSPKPTAFFEEENKENCVNYQEIQDANNSYNNHSSSVVSQELHQLTSTPAGAKLKSNIQLRTDFEVEFPEGCFFGLGKHKDGAEISKFYTEILTWKIALCILSFVSFVKNATNYQLF